MRRIISEYRAEFQINIMLVYKTLRCLVIKNKIVSIIYLKIINKNNNNNLLIFYYIWIIKILKITLKLIAYRLLNRSSC